jgi:AmiR/NasT family two-component response regulator
VAIAQALADIATVAILQHRALLRSEALNDELASALNSRVIIEQAKGMIAEHLRIDVDRAFVLLRTHARDHDEPLADAAAAITAGVRSPSDLRAVQPPA